MANILIIDDDPDIRFLIREALEKKGYTIYESAEGREGLATLRKIHIELVITDLVMPKMDGFELIKQIRKEYPEIRIIASTGARFGGSKLKLLERARKLGADRIIPKPFDLEELFLQIKEVLPEKEFRPHADEPKTPPKTKSSLTNYILFLLLGIVIGFLMAMLINKL